ncbi:hypothetical protein AMTRI_Chr13g124060 [Amborella trichopoda]
MFPNASILRMDVKNSDGVNNVESKVFFGGGWGAIPRKYNLGFAQTYSIVYCIYISTTLVELCSSIAVHLRQGDILSTALPWMVDTTNGIQIASSSIVCRLCMYN